MGFKYDNDVVVNFRKRSNDYKILNRLNSSTSSRKYGKWLGISIMCISLIGVVLYLS